MRAQTKTIWLIIFLCAMNIVQAQKDLTVSLIIPCHPDHAQYLHKLLKLYEEQTNLPDEVVISISEVQKIDPTVIRILRDEKWLFPVKIIESQKKLIASLNRNIASNHATKDIFMYQDADDLPHPQRIEVIKHFFKKYNLDFLLHKFTFCYSSDWKGRRDKVEFIELEKIKDVWAIRYDVNEIKYNFIHTYQEAWKVGHMLFGQPVLRKHVFEKIQWPNIPIHEDDAFDEMILKTFKKCMMIHCSLDIYFRGWSATPYHLYRG